MRLPHGLWLRRAACRQVVVLISRPISPLECRARVLLVAAKCLAHDSKLEAAIEYTREVRAHAARRSALPGGFSGVASTVTHEAFKLEVRGPLIPGVRCTTNTTVHDHYCDGIATSFTPRYSEPILILMSSERRSGWCLC